MLAAPIFHDRTEAGQVLAEALRPVLEDEDAIILALPRGGVPVAFEIARALGFDLDVFLVRKLGVPGHEELAMGAVASGGVRVVNEGILSQLRIPDRVIEETTEREKQEIARRERLYREGRPALSPAGRTAVLVDDGLATGATMLAAARALRALEPKRVIAAAPVASREACEDLAGQVEKMVCAATPEPFYAVGAWYEDFAQTADEEVTMLLEQAARRKSAGSQPDRHAA